MNVNSVSFRGDLSFFLKKQQKKLSAQYSLAFVIYRFWGFFVAFCDAFGSFAQSRLNMISAAQKCKRLECFTLHLFDYLLIFLYQLEVLMLCPFKVELLSILILLEI